MATQKIDSGKQSAFPGMSRAPKVPMAIVDQHVLSDTSVAADCFVYQRFSGRLQAYLVDYVNMIYSEFPRYH